MKFVDELVIHARSGNGGRGCLSFRREKYIPRGGPDGGSGGKGGDVVLVADASLNTLFDFRHHPHFKAKNGRPGSGKNKHGASAQTLSVKVPVGTTVLEPDGKTQIIDLNQEGKTWLMAKGGDGGTGNAAYKSSTNQAPRNFELGEEGEEKSVRLRLRLMADAGLVGLPNAGKSTLLGTLSKAHPKVGNYPFTTLYPSLGVVYADYTEFVVADIPGLIKGAHKGYGLGDRFLGHVERCSLLVHILSGEADLEECIKNYKTITEEIRLYNPRLLKQKQLVVLNKCDLLTPEQMELRQKGLSEALGQKVVAISALARINIPQLIEEMARRITEPSETE